MRVHINRFADGARWVGESLALWKKAPALTAYLAFGYLLGALLASAVPLIGQFLAAAVMPILQVGMLNGMRAAARSDKPGPEILFSGFQGPWQALATVGVLNLLANLLVLLLVRALWGDAFSVLDTLDTGAAGELPVTPLPTLPLLVFLLLSLPITAAYWFAPPLIAWYGVAWPKALFFSLYTCLRNWGALLVWSLAMGALIVGVALGIAVLYAALPILGLVALFVVPMVLVPVLFAGYYLQTRDCFTR